jgi:hypothetical protein
MKRLVIFINKLSIVFSIVSDISSRWDQSLSFSVALNNYVTFVVKITKQFHTKTRKFLLYREVTKNKKLHF